MTNKSIAAGVFAAIFSTAVAAPAFSQEKNQQSSDYREEQRQPDEQESLGESDEQDRAYADRDEDRAHVESDEDRGYVEPQRAGEAYHDPSRCRESHDHTYVDQNVYSDEYDDSFVTEYGPPVGVYAPSYVPRYGGRTVIYFGGSSHHRGRFHARSYPRGYSYHRGGHDGRHQVRSHRGSRDRSQGSRNHGGSRSRGGSRSDRSRR